jgi:hypothetical protein
MKDSIIVWRGWQPNNYKPKFERNYLGLWVPVEFHHIQQYSLFGKPIVLDGTVGGTIGDIQIGGVKRFPFRLMPTNRPGWFKAEFTAMAEIDE